MPSAAKVYRRIKNRDRGVLVVLHAKYMNTYYSMYWDAIIAAEILNIKDYGEKGDNTEDQVSGDDDYYSCTKFDRPITIFSSKKIEGTLKALEASGHRVRVAKINNTISLY